MRRSFDVLVCLLFFGLTVCTAQTAEEVSVLPSKLDEPPATLPADCPASLVIASDQTTGSESFVRFKRLLTTMELGHIASAQWLDALHVPPSSDGNGSVGAAYMHTNIGLSDALNGYLCASFLTGKVKKGKAGSPDEMAARSFISVYNMMALESIQLRAEMKAIAENAEKGKEAMPVSSADKMSKILQDRKDVGSDLQNAIVLVALLSVDNSDPNAKTTETLSMTLDERADLLKQVTELASEKPVDEFTRNAELLQEFLEKHDKGKSIQGSAK